jgi:hypothetical protein
MKEAQTVTDFADASHSKSAKSTATTVLYGIFLSVVKIHKTHILKKTKAVSVSDHPSIK